MSHPYDLIVRNGTVLDGTGADPIAADVAIKDGVIAAVGTIPETAEREIDAQGKLVTPGFVDIHTHYDAQAMWDSHLAPSTLHGVTTVVMGNCGVGFAPCRPDDREKLVELMEGVEDIPGAVMHEAWSGPGRFPRYLDALEGKASRRRRLRTLTARRRPVNVMGDRAVAMEPRLRMTSKRCVPLPRKPSKQARSAYRPAARHPTKLSLLNTSRPYGFTKTNS